MIKLDSEQFWNEKWQNKQTSWDIGHASTAICQFMEQYENKDAHILIPGCGNAYEAEYLSEIGFTNIKVLDISETLVKSLEIKFENNPAIQVFLEDFFQHSGKYDVIIEQTFFCAIHPSLRIRYTQKMNELLKCNGLLVGLLFNRTFESYGPPYGGNLAEYQDLFKDFDIIKMETCFNSIPPREGNELFIEMLKKC